jgi:hypothetical protein
MPTSEPFRNPFPNPLRDNLPETAPLRNGVETDWTAQDGGKAGPPESQRDGRRVAGFRFSIGSLFAAMFIASVVSAGASLYVKYLRGSDSAKFAFTLFILVAPVMAMIVVSVVMSLFPKRKARRRPKADSAAGGGQPARRR